MRLAGWLWYKGKVHDLLWRSIKYNVASHGVFIRYDVHRGYMWGEPASCAQHPVTLDPGTRNSRSQRCHASGRGTRRTRALCAYRIACHWLIQYPPAHRLQHQQQHQEQEQEGFNRAASLGEKLRWGCVRRQRCLYCQRSKSGTWSDGKGRKTSLRMFWHKSRLR